MYKVGCDCVKISRFEKLIKKNSFVTNTLSELEMKTFLEIKDETDKIMFLAKRFSCKEAYLKMLGKGITSSNDLKKLTLITPKNKKPYFLNIKDCDVSLSHDNGMLFCVVVKGDN